MIKRMLLVLMVTALVLCAPNAAAEGEPDTGAFNTFSLRGSNGYRVTVLASSKPGFKHGQVIVWVAGRDGVVLYLAPAMVTATSIDADLGAVGRISVDFEPVGEPEPMHSQCADSGSAKVQPGFWVGPIELHGEEGFTQVETTKAKAIVSPLIEAVCGPGIGIGETTGRGIPGARLIARSATKKHAIYLQVNQNRPGGPVRVESSLEERRGRLLISRDVVRNYGGGTFEFDPELKSSVLTPPAPFAGSAAFRRDAKAQNRWTGNLTLDFPGRADVSMTGSRFKATMWHAKRTEDRHLRARPVFSPWPSTKPPKT